jgi:hypothetical protein
MSFKAAPEAPRISVLITGVSKMVWRINSLSPASAKPPWIPIRAPFAESLAALFLFAAGFGPVTGRQRFHQSFDARLAVARISAQTRTRQSSERRKSAIPVSATPR